MVYRDFVLTGSTDLDFLKLTWSAKAAFENRDYPGSVACAKKRLGLYNATVYALAWDLRAAFPALAQRESLWAQVEASYLRAVEGRYEADLALAYIHSARRRVHHGEWKPVEYGWGEQRSAASSGNAVYEKFACSWPVDHRVVQRILEVAELSVPVCPLKASATVTPTIRVISSVYTDRARTRPAYRRR